MQLFYSNAVSGDSLQLEDEENRHAVSVLRKKTGDVIHVFDGVGNLYTARLERINKRTSELQILEKNTIPRRKYYLHLLMAPTKSSDRTEWALEKAIEMGVERISFVRCQRSERKQVNMERMQKVALSAAKQSLSWYLPQLDAMRTFEECMADQLIEPGYIAACEGERELLHSGMKIGETVRVFIGPEGDFSPEEFQQALSAGWKGLSLGEKRLRSETAAVQAVAQFNLLF